MNPILGTASPLWRPYTQMKTSQPPIRVLSAEGCVLDTDVGPLIDGISAWWSVIHGYNHPTLNAAIQVQLSKMAHCMLGGLVHDSALKLADQLVACTPDSLQHVFYSDSGSVAMEVAIKMAIQAQMNTGRKKKVTLGYLQGAYHGDTTGVMAICDPEEGMHHLFSGILHVHPMLSIPDRLLDLDARCEDSDRALLESYFEEYGETMAGMVVEPLIQGAGGFRFYSRDWLTELVACCRAHDVLVIVDEIATGCGRTGKMWALDHTTIQPDIMATGKGLTGGYSGHAATLASSSVFESFYSDDQEKAFMHGPTFMGNPLATAVASASIELLTQPHYLDQVQRIERQLMRRLKSLSHPAISAIRVQGALGVIELNDTYFIHKIEEYAVKNGVWLRGFRNVIYTAPPYVISEEELDKVCDCLTVFFT